MISPIPYGRQNITDEDIKAVTEVLKADYLTQGPKITEFEEAFANYIGCKYAVAVSNGTAALHLSVMALGLEKDDFVICTPLTFAASVNCVLYCGGNVLFADIDPETYLMDLESVKNLISRNPDKNIRGIIPVDFAGRVPQLDAFRAIADEHKMWILEDACHAPGGSFKDRNNAVQLAGNGVFVDASIFSFHPVKHIATGEGGMITTNDKAIYDQLMQLRTHGIVKDVDSFTNTKMLANGNVSTEADGYPAWYMEMQSLGYNYRITDIQAALGISQLQRADEGIQKRKDIAAKYARELQDVPGILSASGEVEGHAYHLYILEVENRRELYDYLREHKVYAQIHYFPVHLMPYYQKQGWKEGDLPNAEKYYSRCISIPMFPTLTETEQDYVIQLIKKFYHES